MQARALTFVLLLSLLLARSTAVPLPQPTRETPESATRLVVAITSQFESGSEFGSGIVVGAGGGRLYIATAEHVIRQSGEVAKRIEVKLTGSTPAVTAEVFRRAGDGLDLAALTVTQTANLNLEVAPFDLRRAADLATARRGDPVFALGNLQGGGWRRNVAPDALAQVAAGAIRFDSSFIGKGLSGGALFNERWQILGMIVRDDPPVGEALSIERVTATLKTWGVPVLLRTPPPVIAAGDDVSCRISTDGSLACWGNVGLTLENYTPGLLPVTGTSFQAVSAGIRHVCALAFDWSVHCFGWNRQGELGRGSTSESFQRSNPVSANIRFASISAGVHTCGLDANGVAYCWGPNNEAQLGSSGKLSLVPTPVETDLRFKSISAGYLHTCGVATDDKAYCWGSNEIASLGDRNARSTSFEPVAVAGGLRFATVAAGYAHTCGLTVDAEAYCWGDNEYGMLGNGTNVASSEPVRVAGGRKYTTLSVAIGSHTCALTRAGEAFCWGGNDDGQLGDGSTQSRNAPVPVAGNHRFASIAAGHFHTCAVTLDDEVYCWGGKNTPPLTGRDGGSLVPIQVRPERMAVQRP